MDNLSCFLLFLIVLLGMRWLAANQIHREDVANPRNTLKPRDEADRRFGSKS
jgi:hypothetical protein